MWNGCGDLIKLSNIFENLITEAVDKVHHVPNRKFVNLFGL